MRFLVILVTSATLSGCASFLPEEPLAGNGSAKAIAVQVFTPQMEGMHAPIRTIIGPVAGYSCKNKPWDPLPSDTAALEQLKIRAAVRGADGVIGVIYSRGGTSLATNCWSSVEAAGTAVIFGGAK